MTIRRVALLVLGWSALLVLLAPLVVSTWVSFSPDSFLTPPTKEWSLRWFSAFFADRRWVSALWRSLATAATASLVALAFGGPAAYAVARHRFAGRALLAGSILAPACVPPVVLGMGLLPLLYAARLQGHPAGLVLAHGLLGMPVVYLVLRTHLDQTSPDLELAARGLGATPGQTARRITLPLALPATLAGAVAAFVGSLNEAMVTLFLATPATETLPAVIWPQLRYAASPLVAVASCVSVAVTCLGAVSIMAWIARARHQKGE
jgi:ABC-type spermidine/putrescine transport system permease subunit II